MRKATLSFPFHTAHFRVIPIIWLWKFVQHHKYNTSGTLLSGTGYGFNFNFDQFLFTAPGSFIYSHLSRSSQRFVLITSADHDYNRRHQFSKAELKKTSVQKVLLKLLLIVIFKEWLTCKWVSDMIWTVSTDFQMPKSGFVFAISKRQPIF
jgi:hypothetical protein